MGRALCGHVVDPLAITQSKWILALTHYKALLLRRLGVQKGAQ